MKKTSLKKIGRRERQKIGANPANDTGKGIVAPGAAPDRSSPRLVFKTVEGEGTDVQTSELSFDGMSQEAGYAALCRVLAITEPEAVLGIIGEITTVLSTAEKGIETLSVDYAMALMKGIQPRDQIETMLAAQMVVVHMASMQTAARLHRSTTLKVSGFYETTLNKLMRTFVAQLSALKNHRSPYGQQKVTVEHVNVHDGGQAIVGSVTGGGVGANRK